MSKLSILVISNDRSLHRFISRTLHDYGVSVVIAQSWQEGFKMVRENLFGGFLLDYCMSQSDPERVLHYMVNTPETAQLPFVLIIENKARVREHLKISGFADQFLTKPIRSENLRAKVQAMIDWTSMYRKTSSSTKNGIELIEFARVVRINRKSVQLTQTEFALLSLFIEHPGIALTRRSIIETLKEREGLESAVKERTIDYHIARLRKKLGAMGRKITSVYGVGYRFVNSHVGDSPYRFEH